jgi:hypothetical protein
VTEHAAVFDGLDDYVEVADHPDYAIATTGELTVVARIRPDSLEMPAQERTGYVHWLGKGVPGQDEWTSRMYQLGNREGRDNRISCYGFNLDARAGGTRFGIGSHFQDELTPGQWLLDAGPGTRFGCRSIGTGCCATATCSTSRPPAGRPSRPSTVTPRSASAPGFQRTATLPTRRHLPSLVWLMMQPWMTRFVGPPGPVGSKSMDWSVTVASKWQWATMICSMARIGAHKPDPVAEALPHDSASRRSHLRRSRPPSP